MDAAGKDWDDLKAAFRLTRAGIKKWRDGDFKALTAANVFALSDFLGCDPRWLALGESSRAANSISFGRLQAAWALVNDDGRQELLRHADYVASQERFRAETAPTARLS